MPSERLLYLLEAKDQSFGDALKSAASAANLTDDEIDKLTQSAAELETTLKGLTKAGVNPSHETFQAYQKQLDQVNQKLQGTTRGLGGLGGGLKGAKAESDRAGLALLDLTRIVEDSSYGIRGMANNINPAIQSFQRLRAEAGTTGGALVAMTKSMMGPGGLMLGIGVVSSVLITFGPQLKKVFFEGAAAAEELRKRADEAFRAVLKFESDLAGAKVTPGSIRGVMAATTAEIERRKALIEKMEQDLREATARDIGSSRNKAERDAMAESIARIRTKLALDERALEALEKQSAEYRAQANIQGRLLQLGAELAGQTDDVADSTERATDAANRGNDALKLAIALRKQEAAVLLQMQRALARGGRQGATGRDKRTVKGGMDVETLGETPDSPLRGFSAEIVSEMEAANAAFSAGLHSMSASYVGWASNLIRDHDQTMLTWAGGFSEFSNAAQLMFDKTEGRAKGYFDVMKAFAIAEATINTFRGAVLALAQGGVAGHFLAAGVIASGAAMVAKIAATQPGGSGAVGGAGTARSYDPQMPARAAQTFGVSASPQNSQRVYVVGKVSGRNLELVQVNQHEFDRAAGRIVTG